MAACPPRACRPRPFSASGSANSAAAPRAMPYGASPPTTWSAPTARTAGSAPSSGWTSWGTPTRRTGCWPTSTWTGTLLDSYGQERGPVAVGVLALTHTLVRLGTATHPVRRAVRNTVVPVAGRLAPVQRRAVRRISHTSVAYPASQLTYPGRGGPGLRPGERAPDLAVTGDGGSTRLYEVLRHGRHVLLGPDGNRPAWARPDEVVVVTAADGRADWYLLRPDGYVAARGSPASPDSLLAYLRLVFGLG